MVTAIVVVIISLILVVAIIVVSTVVRSKYRRRRQQSSSASAQYRPATQSDDIEVDVERLPVNDHYDPDAAKTSRPPSPRLERLAQLACDHNSIVFGDDLRKGAFGRVFQATLPLPTGQNGLRAPPSSSSQQVVVKTFQMPDEVSDAVREVARKDFVRAAELIASLNHPNIVRIVGACLRSDPMCLVFEYMPGGDLVEYLREIGPTHHIHRNDAERTQKIADRVAMARQVANAMVYLGRQEIVHRDLAARNCLVANRRPSPPDHRSTATTAETPVIVKLADFGLAVRLEGRDFHLGSDDEEISVRWMPPEVIIESRFSPASDVYSFAVLAWEIFAFGQTPYGEFTLTQEVAKRIVSGRLLEQPDMTPTPVYSLMRRCWDHVPLKRPTFMELDQKLDSLEKRIRTREMIF